MNRSISVVIPNYNGKELLEANLPTVYHALQTSGITDYEVIISDDASSDNSVEFIKKNYPDILLVENAVNKGFSGNTNTGIFKAGKELILILNSDVVLTTEYFKPLLPYFDKPDTFGVMGLITSIGSDKIQDGAKYPDYSFGYINSFKNYLCTGQSSLYTLFLSGANALVDRAKTVELGAFSELYNPYYNEDVDLGLKAWRAGYKCYFEQKAVCKHPISSTIKKESSKKVKIISRRNKMYMHFIHLQNAELIYFLIISFFNTLFRTLMLDINHLKSYCLFLASLNKCRTAKASISTIQKKKGITVTVRNVVDEIKKSIPATGIEIF
jgi:GT2 family glycosyltransferase